MPKKYLSTQEAAARANLTDSSGVRRAILNGWLKATRIGERTLMLEEKEVDRWIKDGRRMYPKKGH